MKHMYLYIVVALLAALVMGGMVVLAYDAAPTGYYLPKGYKVEAKARFPGCGFWPGDYVGDIVGVSTSGYEVLVVGKCEKAWNGGVWDCFKVYWIEGGQQKEVANIHSTPEEDHTIVIVYGYDGMVKISIDGQLAYSFVGTTDKYSIVAQGAKVSTPEPLPEDGSDSGTGEGYNPPSVSELQVQYLLLGAGATAIAVPVIYMFVKGGRGRRKAKANMAILLIIMIIMGMIAITTYYVYRTVTTPFHILPLTEEIGDKPILVTLQFGAIKPGQVYELAPDKQGWQIKEKDTRLYEKLELTNIDLSVNDVVAPDLWDWYFDGEDDYILYDWPDTTLPASGVYEWCVVDKVVSDGQSPNGLGDNTGGWWWIALMFVGDINIFKLTEEHSYSNYDERNTLAYMTNTTGEPAIIASIKTSNGYTREWAYTWTEKKAVFTVSNGELAYTVKRLDTSETITKTVTGDTSQWTSIDYKSLQISQSASSEYKKPSVLVAYAYLKNDQYLFIVDATFYNGTHYFDLINGYAGTSYGGVTRVPAENPHLWLVKNLESDNKLHFMYFPEGTIVRIKDSSGNVIREFIISGAKAGNTSQVLDYSISLDTTTLVGASVEAFVPSMKVRVYAPSSSYVAILGEDGTKYGEYVVGADGYVDIPLTNPLKNAYIVVYADQELDTGLNIDVKDLGGGKLEVKIYNDKGVLIPGLLVRLVDPANVVLDYGVTDESGTVELDAGRPLPEATILVDGVWDGTIYRLSKTVSLAESMSGEEQGSTTSLSSNTYKYLLLGLFLIIVLAIALVMVRQR